MGKWKLAVTDIDELIAELVSKSDHKRLTTWAADCAERVLPYFKEKYPQDNRPQEAIEAARAWEQDELNMIDARKAAFAAHAAAREVEEDNAARSAARASGHAAATAHVATHAIAASTYAVTAVRDVTKTSDADAPTIQERDWQYQHLLALTED